MDQYKYWSILLLQEAAAAKGTTIWLRNTADTTDYSSCIWGELSLTANMLHCLQKQNIKPCVSHASVILNWTLVKILSCSTVHSSCVRVAAKKLVLFCCVTHTHTHPFNGSFSGTTQVSQYQKGKTNLDFTEARDSGWQWHQLGHMQVCT